MGSYTIVQLDRMIAAAKRLGFQDDVDHWTAERAAMKGQD